MWLDNFLNSSGLQSPSLGQFPGCRQKSHLLGQCLTSHTVDTQFAFCLCSRHTYSLQDTHSHRTQTMTDTNISRAGHQDGHFLWDRSTCQPAAFAVWGLAVLLVGLLVKATELQSLFSWEQQWISLLSVPRWWHLHCPTVCCPACRLCLICSSKWLSGMWCGGGVGIFDVSVLQCHLTSFGAVVSWLP